jgi:hypothetical protein
MIDGRKAAARRALEGASGPGVYRCRPARIALPEPPQLDGAVHPADPDAAREGITDICWHLLA